MRFWDGSGISWTNCTLLQTDKHTDTLSLNFYKPMLFLCQSTENSMHTDYKL